jgi:3-oxoacyl-[acyl-carrier protein] reductase
MTERGTAVITGGSRGIGAAIAVELAGRGCDIAVTYARGVEAAEAVAERCRAHGVRAMATPFDLGRPDTAQDVVEAVREGLGPPRVVVLNAGTWSGGRLEHMDPDEWWSVVERNVRGNHALTRAVLPALREAGDASIVLVSSAVGLIGFPGDTAYASSKSAMIGLGRSLAKELARDRIRVNVLAPGFVETDMTAEVGEAARERIGRRLVIPRFGTPEEVARAAAFLALDATYCTGVVLPVDGGWTI